jgi:transposase
MRRDHKIRLTSEQEDDLQRFARSRTLPARLVERAKMLVLGSTGHGAEEIAAQLGVVRQTVTRWLGRFEAQGMKGIEDAPRSGRPPLILPPKIAEIVEKTTQEKPAGATHWSTRTCQWRRAKGPFFCPIFRWFFAEPFSLVSVSQNGPRRQGSASPRPITARP